MQPFLLFIPANAQYINSKLLLIYYAFVGLNDILYTLDGTYYQYIICSIEQLNLKCRVSNTHKRVMNIIHYNSVLYVI
jgi:hypothetical protein